MPDIKLTLAAARVNAGMTQQEVAQALGVNRALIMKIENGKRPVKQIELLALANLYGIPADLICVQNGIA